MRRFPRCDFVVKYNPDVDTQTELSKKILYNILIRNRLLCHKPSIVFISGDSGEGKSYAGLVLQSVLLEAQNLDIKEYINDINVYIPLDYPVKKRALLKDKRLKKVNVLCIHEAREIIKAKLWYNFLNQAIGDINAMSRAIKPLCIIIISQFIRDISADIRYTLNFYCKASRSGTQPTKLRMYVLYKDDHDLEKPKLKKRYLSGYLVLPSGKYRRFTPKHFSLRMPDKEVRNIFDSQDTQAKTKILDKKINKLIDVIEKDIGTYENVKVKKMIEFYSENLDQIGVIGKRTGTRWRLKKEAVEMHELKKNEAKEFEVEFEKVLIQKGILEDGTTKQ